MTTDDTLRSRVPGSRWKLWLLMGANRWAVAGLILGLLFVSLAVLVTVDPVPLEEAIAKSDPVETLFQGMLTAIITGVTLVVTINQLVISQELGAVGDQRERMEGSLAFREDVADQLKDPISPPDPASFLRALLAATEERADELRDAVADTEDEELRETVDQYVEDLSENADSVRSELDGAQFGTFDVIQSALGFNYSLKIYEGKRIQSRFGSGTDAEGRTLGPEANEALDDVVTLLKQFGPAREHVKTLYFQWVLVDLSRAMLYAAVPALIVTIGSILTIADVGTIGGSTVGVANHTWVVLLATMVALTPFAILVAYVLRIATVAKRTLAIGPFVLRTTSRSIDIDES